jgi:hypothetical protein
MKSSVSGSLVIGGQDRPYTTDGLAAVVQALHHRKDQEGQPLSAAVFRNAFGPNALRQGLTGDDARDYLYAALVAGYGQHRFRVDFTFLQVGQWLSETPEIAQSFWEAVKPPPKPRPAKRIGQAK